jgi:hypothetical protein
VPEGVHGIDMLQPFRGQCLREVLFADAVYAMPGEFFSALTDKEAVLIEGFWHCSIPVDIAVKELDGLVFQFYEPEPICLAQDGQCFLLGIEVVEVEGCDFTGPGAGVKQQMKEGVIPEALLSFEIHSLKGLSDLVMIEEADEGFLISFLGDIEEDVCQFTVLRIHKADHFGKGLDGCKAVIAGSWQILSVPLKRIEKGQDQLRGNMLHSEGSDLDTVMVCGKGKQ